MESVLGDGLSSELGCWMEACVARVTIRNAGEFNGFLKPKVRLFAEPLRFTAGELVIPPGFRPAIDAGVLAAHEIACERFGPRRRWAALHRINGREAQDLQAVANRVSIERLKQQSRG